MKKQHNWFQGKETDAAIEKALQLAKEIEIPTEVLAKESTVEVAQLGLELTENLQQMIEVEGVLKTSEDARRKLSVQKLLLQMLLKVILILTLLLLKLLQ